MKKLMIAIIVLILSVNLYAGDTPSLSKGGAYSSSTGNPFVKAGYGGQCTAYAWGRAYEKLGIKLPMTQSAKFWVNYKSNFKTDMNLQENSIVVWGGDSYNKYGHVAFVEKINGNTVYFTEANVETYRATNYGGGYDGYLKAWTLSKFKAYRKKSGSIIGYIHLQSSTPTPSKTLKYIQPYCSNSWMTVGDTQSCTAKAYYSDNSSQDITSSASWNVMTNTTALSVASRGKVTAKGAENNTASKIKITYPNAIANSVIVNVEGVDGKNPTIYKGASCFKSGNFLSWKKNIPNGTLYLFYSKICKSNIGYLVPNTTSSKTSVKIVRADNSTQSYSGTGRIYTPMLYAPSKKVCVYGSVNGASLSKGVCK